MIKKIQSLKRFGVFNEYNHKNDRTEEFRKFNLIYGWNGSGKSTLAHVFRCIENKTISTQFTSSEFNIIDANGVSTTHANVKQADLNIHTFNQEFIKENISWDSVVASILLVDQQKIDERQKLEQLKDEQERDKNTRDSKVAEIEKLTKKVSVFETNKAGDIKREFIELGTKIRKYQNYDKRSFTTFINNNHKATLSANSKLSSEKLEELRSSLRTGQKDSMRFTNHPIDQDAVNKRQTQIEKLLGSSVISQTIKRLVENADITSWVEKGLDLHKQHGESNCEFCGNNITEGRLKQLEAHFNEDYKDLQKSLEREVVSLEGGIFRLPSLPEAGGFYTEYQENFREASNILSESCKELNERTLAWKKVVEEKIASPLDTSLRIEEIENSHVAAYNAALNSVMDIVSNHNKKTENFEIETVRISNQLESHYVTSVILDSEYHENKSKILALETSKKALDTVVKSRQDEIRALESLLSNESLGATEFNKSLQRFLGRIDLELRFNPKERGYEILRYGSERVLDNLSEGEKTAIAFVYFITKLKENGNNIGETIVVVDDPVSSFDSNHLFHAYSFLKNNCNKASQLFVLTHNFTYFKLVRDWFSRDSRNKKHKGNPRASFYTIETSTTTPRYSTIKNADDSLITYNSEYHFIFSKLYKLKDNSALSGEDALLTANLSRKLLESFFSFKFPKQRSDLAQLLDRGVRSCKNTDEITKDKIYKFINKYSHSDAIVTNEDHADNLLGESHNIIASIFTWMEEVDKTHYDEMVKVVDPS